MAKKQRDQRPRHETPASLLMPAYENKLEDYLGARLRELRRQQGLSLRSLAEKSGLSANTLSLIENGKTSPSVSTLQQIALALNITITSFFEGKAARKPVIYTQRGKRASAPFSHGLLEDVGAGGNIEGVQSFIVTVNPQSESTPQRVSREGIEFLYCISGQVSFSVLDDEYQLQPGDTLMFPNQAPHAWRNPTDEPAELLVMLIASDERNRPTQIYYPL